MRYWLALCCLLIADPALALSPNLTWTDTADNEDGFYVYRRWENDPPAATPLATIPTPDTQSYLDTVPDETRRYCYTVSAYNQYGESARSNEACTQTLQELLPGAPASLQIVITVTIP